MICPVCKAAAKAPCLFRVKDGYQELSEGTIHIRRARLDYMMETFQPKREENESDLDFVIRIDKATQELFWLWPADKTKELDFLSIAPVLA